MPPKKKQKTGEQEVVLDPATENTTSATTVGTTQKGRSVVKVEKVNTGKDTIIQCKLAAEGLIPRHPFRWLLSGQSASGKSTLLVNIMRWYGPHYFDRVIAIGPTVRFDDIWKSMKIPPKDLIELPTETVLTTILAQQERLIRKHGIVNTPRVLIIFEDIISHQRFMTTPAFTRCFVAGRHFNISIIILTQKYNGVPRVARLQASHVSFFPSKLTEVDTLADDHTPPNMTKKRFRELIKFATSPDDEESHPFLYIDVFAVVGERFRRCMYNQIVL